MTDFSDLPTIQVFPNGTPSDAELEAERDHKHAQVLAEDAAGPSCDCYPCYGYCNWPVTEVIG